MNAQEATKVLRSVSGISGFAAASRGHGGPCCVGLRHPRTQRELTIKTDVRGRYLRLRAEVECLGPESTRGQVHKLAKRVYPANRESLLAGLRLTSDGRLFAEAALLRDHIVEADIPGVSMAELSMGMTGDFEVAIAEGATLVRIGTALFGARK